MTPKKKQTDPRVKQADPRSDEGREPVRAHGASPRAAQEARDIEDDRPAERKRREAAGSSRRTDEPDEPRET